MSDFVVLSRKNFLPALLSLSSKRHFSAVMGKCSLNLFRTQKTSVSAFATVSVSVSTTDSAPTSRSVSSTVSASTLPASKPACRLVSQPVQRRVCHLVPQISLLLPSQSTRVQVSRPQHSTEFREVSRPTHLLACQPHCHPVHCHSHHQLWLPTFSSIVLVFAATSVSTSLSTSA